MMSQTVQKITQQLIDLLPENEQYYRLNEIRSWGFPAFIVQRIKVELERNLAESMLLPDTDWANIESGAVQHAWQQFVQAIRDQARLPASYARAVIETAVADVLDMLTEPRKNIPDVIFGGDDELSFEEIAGRIESVVVYPHFAALLPRYMQKKGLGTLSKAQCGRLIRSADEKITANYSALNWAQTLDPLFVLLDGSIDPSLLRLFFEDKGKNRIAEAFDRRDEPLDRAEFIEVLSSPDLFDSQSIYTSPKVADGPQEQPAAGEEPPVKPAARPEEDENEEEPQSPPSASHPSEEKMPPPEQQDEAVEEPVTGEEYAGNAHWNNKPVKEEENTLSDEQDKSHSTEDDLREMKEGTEPKIKAEKSAPSDSKVPVEPPDVPDVDQREETPIWMNFMSEEDREALESEEELEEQAATNFEEAGAADEEETEENAEDEEPLLSPEQMQKGSVEKQTDQLKEKLSEQEDYFIEEIFGNNRQDYEEAIGEIALYDDWHSASKFIQNEVFEQNLVNLYSEAALDFTDRLQKFFIKKENTEIQ